MSAYTSSTQAEMQLLCRSKMRARAMPIAWFYKPRARCGSRIWFDLMLIYWLFLDEVFVFKRRRHVCQRSLNWWVFFLGTICVSQCTRTCNQQHSRTDRYGIRSAHKNIKRNQKWLQQQCILFIALLKILSLFWKICNVGRQTLIRLYVFSWMTSPWQLHLGKNKRCCHCINQTKNREEWKHVKKERVCM